MTIKREERVLNLVALLLDRKVSFHEIHSLIEGYPPDPSSARRQFERDKDLLREIGIQLETELPREDSDEYRYHILQPRLRELALEDQERRALQIALISSNVMPRVATTALNKLGGREGGATPGDAQVAVEPSPAAAAMLEAIGRSCTVSFQYRNQPRTLEPWALAFRYARLYVMGFDTEREDTRTFRLDRISGDVRVDIDRPAQHDRPVEMVPLFDSLLEHLTPATFRVDSVGASLLAVPSPLDGHGEQETWMTVTREFVDAQACYSFLADAYDHVVLLEPVEWRDGYLERLNGLVQ